MSDDEDEYEYDDDMPEEFEYTDEDEEQDDGMVALENAYYNAKGLRDTDIQAAMDSFEAVIAKEDPVGPWAFKAMKQLVKLQLRVGSSHQIHTYYQRLLEASGGQVSPNAVEKGIQGMLERIAGYTQSQKLPPEEAQTLALAIYDATLRVVNPSGSCPNERLWFKTNLKYGQLLYERNETGKLQNVLKELTSLESSSTQSLEIYALQIQLYSRQKDHKKLRETFHDAMNVRGGIPHPRTIAMIQELGGKMHLSAKEYEAAEKTFFQAFKSYDEAGDPSRLRCLKYLVLASMLHASSINPFDSQEARPYRDDVEIVAMTNLVQAFHNNEIQTFERILRKSQLLQDEFIREHIQDLLVTIRRQVLKRVIRPYTRISLTAISRELNDIPIEDVEQLLVGLILDGNLEGRIDRVDGILYKHSEGGKEENKALSEKMQKYQALETLADLLTGLSNEVMNASIKDSTPGLRSFVH